MNRLPLAFVFLSFAIQCGADQPKRVVTYQTLPGSTTRDWRAPTKVTKGTRRWRAKTARNRQKASESRGISWKSHYLKSDDPLANLIARFSDHP
jgi:hypothetical protein